MAVITVTKQSEPILTHGGLTKRIWREYGVSGGAADDTFTTTLGRAKRLKAIYIVYDAAPTYTTNITADLDAGLGATYDVVGLITISTADSAQYVTFWPGATTAVETGQVPLGAIDFVFGKDDQLIITVPDGGGAILATVQVVWEELR